MSKRRVSAVIERFPVRGAFVIARGAKTHVDVVVATVAEGGSTGRGEATPVYYRGETAEGVLAAVEAAAAAVADGADRADLLGLLPAGAARNALDAALWDLAAKASGVPVWRTIGLPEPRPLLTAYTISLDEPAAMERAARAVHARELLKIKLSGEGCVERVAAVRRGAPHARLIVDANEAWGGADIERLAAAMAGLGVELIEQPVPAGDDALLDGVRSAVPLCADETIHDRAGLDAVVGRYRFVNVKLDKAGGLTEALALAHAAATRGLGLMTGCMLGTSLALAPAFFVAMHGQYADLDGPLLIEDRPGGLHFAGSDVWPPAPALWGEPADARVGRAVKPAVTSLSQLAKLAGVSIATVSRSLAGNTVIAEATRRRIVALADDHGFHINQAARNLRLRRTGAIGVVLPLGHEAEQHLSDPFFMSLLGPLADAVAERGYDLLLSRVIPRDDRWLDAIVDGGRVDGVIVVGQSDQADVIARVGRRYRPIVTWGAALPGMLTVGSDNVAGGRLAADHLLAQGRRRLAFFGNPDVPEFGARHAGFRAAVDDADASPATLLPVHLTSEAAYSAIRDFLTAGPLPDGIVAASDVIAMSSLRALAERGLGVPRDVAVVGYDDVSVATYASPPLTTVRQDVGHGAAAMVDLLFRRLDGEEVASVTMTPRLIIRGSA